MDDVHQELIRLKQRVSEMAASYSCSPRRTPHYTAEGDSFFAKVVDAKAHLDSIQASLLSSEDSRHDQRRGYRGTNTSAWASQPHVSQIIPRHGLSLPSAPLFWSLFNSLRTDVRSLDSRVGDLEQSVSNLEDRVDHCLDPLTPGSSAADVPAEPLSYDRQEPLSIPWRAEPGVRGDPFAQYAYPTFCNAANVHQKSVELDATFGSFDRFSACGDHSPSNYYPIPPASDVLAPEGVAFRDKEISDLEELNRSTQDSLRRSEEASYERQSYIQELEAANVDLQRKRADCVAMFRDIFTEKHAEVQQVRAERDAHDEEHRTACQRFHAKEEELTEANKQLRHMCDLHSSKQDGFDKVVSVKDGELQRLQAFLAGKDAEIAKFQRVIAMHVESSEQKDEEVERVTRELNLCKDDLNDEIRENNQLQHMCDLHSRRQDGFDQVVKAKDEELQRLRAFCESKDAVIAKQEEVIARGVILIEQKDDEIERVARDLKLCKEDLDNEIRANKCSSKTLEERDKVIAELRASLNDAPTSPAIKKRASKAPPLASEASYSPFATSGPGLQPEHGTKWSPQPFRNARLPSEQQRAAIWESGLRPVSHTFGRSDWQRNSHDARLSDSVKLLERLALSEESPPHEQDRPRAHSKKSSHVARAPGTQSSGGKSDLPSDTFQPEQLPPLPPRRRISLAGIHGGTGGQERSEPITKHVSMQELPRSRLQPYVEAAEEERRD